MDVFPLRERLIRDYHSYVGSFIKFENSWIEEQVMPSLDAGLLCPDPLIQLIPAFETLERIGQGWGDG